MTTTKASFAKALTTAVLTAALFTAASTAAAHEYKAGAVRIGHPWARPTVQGQMAGGGYLVLDNTGAAADKLLGASSAMAERVELHEMKLDGDVMRMRAVDGIALPAGQKIELKPGGLHMMLTGLKQPLAEGSRFPLTLKFEKAGEVQVEVKVETPKASQAVHQHPDGHKH